MFHHIIIVFSLLLFIFYYYYYILYILLLHYYYAWADACQKKAEANLRRRSPRDFCVASTPPLSIEVAFKDKAGVCLEGRKRRGEGGEK